MAINYGKHEAINYGNAVAEDEVPPGMHRMPDGSLMSDAEMAEKEAAGKRRTTDIALETAPVPVAIPGLGAMPLVEAVDSTEDELTGSRVVGGEVVEILVSFNKNEKAEEYFNNAEFAPVSKAVNRIKEIVIARE